MAGLLKRLFSRSSIDDPVDCYAPVRDHDDADEPLQIPEDTDWCPPEVEGTSIILDEDQIGFLDRQLPKRLVCSRWILAFSTESHGFSLANLYRVMKDWTGPTLLVILDTNGHRFGAFVTDSFRPDHQIRGGGECFVFRLKHPDYSARFNGRQISAAGKGRRRRQSSWSNDFLVVNRNGELEMGIELEIDEEHFGPKRKSDPVSDDDKLHRVTEENNKNQQTSGESHMSEYDFSQHQVWGWAQAHNCFIHGQADSISFGLFDGKMSLWLDDNIEKGRSEASAVFDNEPLAPSPARSDGVFEVVNAEVWIFKQ